MLFHIAGAGPSGLYLAYLIKRSHPDYVVRVFEQNQADVTFGFGVVLSGRGLQFLAQGNAEVVERLKGEMQSWSNQHIVHRGQTVVVDGSSYFAIERLALLRELQGLCTSAGVELNFNHRAERASDLADCDVLVGADGANSAIRDSHSDNFGTQVTEFRNYFAWFGVACPYEAHTLTFRPTEAGAFVAHHYRYTPSMSTFVAEVDKETWDAAGMASMTEDQRRVLTEETFADTLAGQPLISNRSIWRRWRLIDNSRWSFGNIVLIGDALRTAHFSIGSGTRLAMEDAIALWRAFAAEGKDVAAAFARYECERKPVRDKLNQAVELSAHWYERMGSKMRLQPYDFAHDYLLRTNVMTAERLFRESPDFMERYRAQTEATHGSSYLSRY